jgi:hypothetical protein
MNQRHHRRLRERFFRDTVTAAIEVALRLTCGHYEEGGQMLLRKALIAIFAACSVLCAETSVADARSAALKQGKPFLIFVSVDQKVF